MCDSIKYSQNVIILQVSHFAVCRFLLIAHETVLFTSIKVQLLIQVGGKILYYHADWQIVKGIINQT